MQQDNINKAQRDETHFTYSDSTTITFRHLATRYFKRLLHMAQLKIYLLYYVFQLFNINLISEVFLVILPPVEHTRDLYCPFPLVHKIHQHVVVNDNPVVSAPFQKFVA